MDKKIASNRRLHLAKETLRSLTQSELAGVAGGTLVMAGYTNLICIEPPPGLQLGTKSVVVSLCLPEIGGGGPAVNPGGG
jgi:hypothetical protein